MPSARGNKTRANKKRRKLAKPKRKVVQGGLVKPLLQPPCDECGGPAFFVWMPGYTVLGGPMGEDYCLSCNKIVCTSCMRTHQTRCIYTLQIPDGLTTV